MSTLNLNMTKTKLDDADNPAINFEFVYTIDNISFIMCC